MKSFKSFEIRAKTTYQMLKPRNHILMFSLNLETFKASFLKESVNRGKKKKGLERLFNAPLAPVGTLVRASQVKRQQVSYLCQNFSEVKMGSGLCLQIIQPFRNNTFQDRDQRGGAKGPRWPPLGSSTPPVEKSSGS